MLPIKAVGREREKLELQVAAQVERQRRDIVMRCKLWRASHRCGPMYWLRNLTKTENYHWQEMGLEPSCRSPSSRSGIGKSIARCFHSSTTPALVCLASVVAASALSIAFPIISMW